MDGFIQNDGGRAEAGFKGTAGDCVARSIAIATGKPYREVYDALNGMARDERVKRGRKSSARNGVHRKTYQRYLESIGWRWVPTMQIGKGCTVHLCADELPSGPLVVRLSKHLTAMIDGIIHDTYDPRRDVHCHEPYRGQPLKTGQWLHERGDIVCWIERRCVYGYFQPAA